MSTEELSARFPWFEQHSNAVNTVARCLGMELEQILPMLGSRIQSQ